MGQDNTTSVLLHLSPEIFEVLEQYGNEKQISPHYIGKQLFLQAFEQWQNGKLDIKATERARSYYRRGQKQPNRKDRRMNQKQ
jgi:hypothetical protein